MPIAIVSLAVRKLAAAPFLVEGPEGGVQYHEMPEDTEPNPRAAHLESFDW